MTPSQSCTHSAAIQERHHALDWLRVIAFGLLIFYHIGMFYVPWSWHVKSSYVSQAAVPWMAALNPWRLALLFFISGVALRFSADKARAAGLLALSRSVQLGLPLLFGVAVLVMPQTYFQLRQSGEIASGILAFYPHYLRGDPGLSVFMPTWNHLWYLAYILAYTLLALALAPSLRRATDSRPVQAYMRSPAAILLITVAPFILYEVTLSRWFPSHDDFIHDWGQHAHRLTIFLLGFLVARDRSFWASIDRLLFWAILLAPSFYLAGTYWPQPGMATLLGEAGTGLLHTAVQILYAWCCILAMLGLARRYLDRPGRLLRYLTSAVFCYYVVHQTIIVVAGYYLTRFRLGAGAEFALLLATTTAGCGLSYEMARRLGPLAVLLGVGPRARIARRTGSIGRDPVPAE